MLDQIFALYIESLLYTAVGVGIIAGLWSWTADDSPQGQDSQGAPEPSV